MKNSTVKCALFDDDLEKLFKEGNEHGVGDIMKDVWFTDKKRQIQEFSHDQLINGKNST